MPLLPRPPLDPRHGPHRDRAEPLQTRLMSLVPHPGGMLGMASCTGTCPLFLAAPALGDAADAPRSLRCGVWLAHSPGTGTCHRCLVARSGGSAYPARCGPRSRPPALGPPRSLTAGPGPSASGRHLPLGAEQGLWARGWALIGCSAEWAGPGARGGGAAAHPGLRLSNAERRRESGSGSLRDGGRRPAASGECARLGGDRRTCLAGGTGECARPGGCCGVLLAGRCGSAALPPRPVPGRAGGSAEVPVRRVGAVPAAAALRGPSLPNIFLTRTRDLMALEIVKGVDIFLG